MEDLKTGSYNVEGGKLYVNKGKSIECFYDTNQQLITLKPGETKFEAIMNENQLSSYFVSPALWNAQKEVLNALYEKGNVRLLLKAEKIDKIGDFIFTSIIPKAYKVVYANKITVGMVINDKCISLSHRNKYVDFWFVNDEDASFEPDVVVDLNNIEFKWGKKRADDAFGLKLRSSLVLEGLGLYLFNKTPVLDVLQGELEFAKNNRPETDFPVIGVQLASSCKSRTLPQMPQIVNELKKKYSVIVLDEKDENGNYKYDLSQLISLVYMCDVIVCPDSSVLHIAGALKKPIVGLFGHTDGKILAEDYERCLVIQGKGSCNKICWWELSCLEGDSYQEKMDSEFTECLKSITYDMIDKEIDRHLNAKKVFICMLTYNLLEWTKKAIESIRTWYPYQLFVVDNESTDGTQKWLEDNGIDFVSKRHGVAAAQNVGIRKFLESDCEYFLLLNNDVVLKRNTIDNLIEELNSHKEVWGLSAQEVPSLPWGIDETNDLDTFEVIVDIPASAYSCTVFTRECIEKVGEFDEWFTPRYIEDNDYTLRIRLLGHEFARTGKSVFFHVLGGVIKSNKDERKDRDIHWIKNIDYYKEKWGIHPHGEYKFDNLGEETRPGNLCRFIDNHKNFMVVGIKRDMGGYGDIVFSSVLGRELNKKYGSEMIKVIYFVPDQYNFILENLGYTCKGSKADFIFDITDIEFRYEWQEVAKYGMIKSARTEIYLKIAGLSTDNLKPDYRVTQVGKSWAQRQWKNNGKIKIFIVPQGSNPLKNWHGMQELVSILNDAYDVIVNDNKKYNFQSASAIVDSADLIISPETGLSNVAGALEKSIVCIFSNRRSDPFLKMFKTMYPVRGDCAFCDSGCDYKVFCSGTEGPYRPKEFRLGEPECLRSLSVQKVLDKVEQLL